MRNFRYHIAMLIGLQLLVFVAYHDIPKLPLSSVMDFEVLDDARMLSLNPGSLLLHLGTLFSQPLLRLAFMWEYMAFGINPLGYMVVNLVLHGLNAFVLYLLVNMLFHRSRIAIPAATLFALSVGHYGKVLLVVAGLESLLLGFLYLLSLYALIRVDFKHGGRMSSPWFWLGLGLFGLAGLTKPAMFSIMLVLVSYKFFFYRERGGRAVFPPTMMILMAVGVAFAVAKELWGFKDVGASPDHMGVFAGIFHSVKTLFRYLNLMVFPMQVSDLLQSSHPVVRFVYDWRVPIRVLVSLAIVSFGFFGIIFGSRPLRFFISWTVITVIPFSVVDRSGDWLNLQYLYLSAAGFCVILSAGATGCYGLLQAHRWKRWLPWLAPAAFVFMTQVLNHELAQRNRISAERPAVRVLRGLLEYRIENRTETPAP